MTSFEYSVSEVIEEHLDSTNGVELNELLALVNVDFDNLLTMQKFLSLLNDEESDFAVVNNRVYYRDQAPRLVAVITLP